MFCGKTAPSRLVSLRHGLHLLVGFPVATAPRPPVPPPAFVAALGIDAPTWATLQVLLFIATIVLLPLLCSANTETPQARVQLAAARVREAQSRQQLRERLRAFSRQ